MNPAEIKAEAKADLAATTAAKKRIAEISTLLGQIKREKDCSDNEAWLLAKIRRPELFASTNDRPGSFRVSVNETSGDLVAAVNAK